MLFLVQGVRVELLFHIPNVACYRYTTPCWLGRLGLNQRIKDSKSSAFPLGYAPWCDIADLNC